MTEPTKEMVAAAKVAYECACAARDDGVEGINPMREALKAATLAAPSPAPAHAEALRLPDAIDPFTRKAAPDHLTSKVAADALRRLAVQAPAPAPDDKALTQALEERDAASDYIDALLDEVLGTDRHEWTSNYGHADAMAEVRERMSSLLQPMVDKAWGRFEAAVQAPAVGAGWRPMRTAPKDGTAILVLMEASDVPHAVRWDCAHDHGWLMTWDNHRLSAADGPRYWMPCPADPDEAQPPVQGGEP